jgi:nitrile hydratase
MPEYQSQPMPLAEVVTGRGEMPIFKVGDGVKILTRLPIGHYRVPLYVRGKDARVEAVIEPVAVDNEEEGFGRNAGSRLHYYRIAIPLSELWLGYAGPSHDSLRIEVFETWLELI